MYLLFNELHGCMALGATPRPRIELSYSIFTFFTSSKEKTRYPGCLHALHVTHLKQCGYCIFLKIILFCLINGHEISKNEIRSGLSNMEEASFLEKKSAKSS